MCVCVGGGVNSANCYIILTLAKKVMRGKSMQHPVFYCQACPQVAQGSLVGEAVPQLGPDTYHGISGLMHLTAEIEGAPTRTFHIGSIFFLWLPWHFRFNAFNRWNR